MSLAVGRARPTSVVIEPDRGPGAAGAPGKAISARYDAIAISKSFGGAQALSGVSVTFAPGEIHTLVGENGAGKSTLLKVMAGIHQPDSGELVLGGETLRGLTPRSAQQQGIYLVPQEPTLMSTLSALENLFVGIIPRGRLPFSVDWKAMRRSAGQYFEQVGLDIDPRAPASSLSIAQQQLVECARALVHSCNVVFFDEPTSPLTSRESEVLFDVMRRMRERGFALAFISHRLDEVLAISDRITVLRDSRVVTEMTPADATRETLITAMVGHEIAKRERRRRAPTSAETALAVEGLSEPPAFSDVSFSVARGEVLGLAGLVGSGRTEIAEAIFGMRPATGSVTLDGRALARRTPASLIDAGLIYLPEDRGRHGVFAEVDLERNITTAIVPRLARRAGLLRPRAERRVAEDASKRTRVVARSLAAPIKSLSGGNQQRAMFSRWLLAEPRVAIFDEPTRGVDIGAKDDIYEIISDLAASG
ncbi:MAG TPA: sugar ABC transporter ATP-binding protein, partial [Solirubrobacteraceae bacterium]|nr:sugar ABC transporter ATP-binding protein [Solirubrobacteraceae bacterium]